MVRKNESQEVQQSHSIPRHHVHVCHIPKYAGRVSWLPKYCTAVPQPGIVFSRPCLLRVCGIMRAWFVANRLGEAIRPLEVVASIQLSWSLYTGLFYYTLFCFCHTTHRKQFQLVYRARRMASPSRSYVFCCAMASQKQTNKSIISYCKTHLAACVDQRTVTVNVRGNSFRTHLVHEAHAALPLASLPTLPRNGLNVNATSTAWSIKAKGQQERCGEN